MSKQEQNYVIKKETYDWCLKTFKTIEDNFGLNLNVHVEDKTLEDGQIFLFNHFARFETAIPPYIFYKKTGAFSRIIADKHLFSAGESLKTFLTNVGAVPNDLPGLLPFLAAEILRGRKVVIFPEGGMIKDRRVMDESGRFRIFSHVANEFRKHHRGAAILALTLDLFKRRIKDLHEDGDMERLERWRKSLGLDTVEDLMLQANKPTMVIPGTITFYPIRISDNIAKKVVDLFVKKLPSKALDEIIIESNILLKDTDMDIRFGKPLEIHKNWHWWERLLLKKYFLSINSLDELFSLRHEADSWSEQLLAQFIAKETDKIRDQYMEKIYQGITVNFAHIASTAIMQLMEQKIFSIPTSEFHKIMYVCFKRLQAEPEIFMHRSFARPREYKNMLNGESFMLKRFMRTCKSVGLIKEENGLYYFQDKILEPQDYNVIRTENPIVVRSNEAKPVATLQNTIKKTISDIEKITERDIAAMRFDDEERDVAINKQFYSDEKYDAINKQETMTESPLPYLLPQSKKAKVGVLMVHGFLSSPPELRELGDKLYKEGHAVLGMRVSGHGTSPWDLNNRTCEDWEVSVARNYEILSAYCEKVVIIGFSGGGALSLNFAATKPEKLVGVASVCTPLVLKDKMMHLVPFLHGLNKIISLCPKVEGLVPFRPNRSSYPKTNYANMPVHALNELRYLVQKVKKKLKYVTCKAIVIQSTEDPVVNPKAAEKIFKGLSSNDKNIHMIKSDRHGIIYDNVGETHELLIKFVEDAKTTTIKKVHHE